MTLTLYLGDGGKVESSGIAGEQTLTDAQLTMFQQALAKLKFPAPLTSIAKVTYQW